VTIFREGDRVEAVEHIDSTREPKDGGEILPGIVEEASKAYVRARFDDGRTASFWQESGWTAWDGWFRWRLRLAEEASIAAAGEERVS
jgi:hypothetical protein